MFSHRMHFHTLFKNVSKKSPFISSIVSLFDLYTPQLDKLQSWQPIYKTEVTSLKLYVETLYHKSGNWSQPIKKMTLTIWQWLQLLTFGQFIQQQSTSEQKFCTILIGLGSLKCRGQCSFRNWNLVGEKKKEKNTDGM